MTCFVVFGSVLLFEDTNNWRTVRDTVKFLELKSHSHSMCFICWRGVDAVDVKIWDLRNISKHQSVDTFVLGHSLQCCIGIAQPNGTTIVRSLFENVIGGGDFQAGCIPHLDIEGVVSFFQDRADLRSACQTLHHRTQWGGQGWDDEK